MVDGTGTGIKPGGIVFPDQGIYGAFWGESRAWNRPVRIHRTAYVATIGLTVMVIVLGVGSEWIYSYTSQAGAVLSDPSLYINAVLKE